jgi:two-component system response regulator YesN
MNVLVVDDQREVVEGIKNGVCWSKFDINEVHYCYNVVQAKQLMQEHKIHILLSDIEMPMESGLELFAWTRKNYPDIQGIFLTSHAEFQYAKEALKLGSFDYILQPAKYEEIEDAIYRVLKEIRKDNEVKEYYEFGKYCSEEKVEIAEEYLMKFIKGEAKDPSRFYRLLEARGEVVSEDTLFLPVMLQIHKWQISLADWNAKLLKYTFSNILQELLEESKLSFLLLQMDERMYTVVLYSKEAGEIASTYSVQEAFRNLQRFCAEYLAKTAIYLGQPSVLEGVLKEYEKLLELGKNNVTLQSKIFISEDAMLKNENLIFDMSDRKRWQELLSKGFVNLVKHEVRAYFDHRVENQQINLDYLLKFHQNFTMLVFSVAEEKGINAQNLFQNPGDFDGYMKSFGTLDTLLEWIDKILDLFQAKTVSEEEEISQIKKAQEYIAANLDKNISRTEIAEQVYLNSDYLSRLFKREVGLPLKDYMISEKIKLAKKLLVTTNLSVGIIASKVGYSNFSHFTLIFKKVEGVTPNEYRQQSKIS